MAGRAATTRGAKRTESQRPARHAALVAHSTVADMGQSRRKQRAQQQPPIAATDGIATPSTAAIPDGVKRESRRGRKRALEELGGGNVALPPPNEDVDVKVEVEDEPSTEGAAPQSAFDEDTQRFLQSLADDERLTEKPRASHYPASSSSSRSRKRIERRLSFELPFSKSEIEHIETRRVEYRPPHYGKISKCVYVSNRVPSAAIPVHKCTCYQEKSATNTTKRATELASAKQRLLLAAAADKEPAGRPRRSNSERRLSANGQQKKQVPLPPPVLLCGENCYNRMMFISCSDETCSAPDPALCSNRAIKRRQVKSVRVEFIRGPGFGLFANEEIQAGDFIIEYVGEVIDDAECERRLIHSRAHGETHFYMLELEKDVVIDARYRSNESRFINHSCDPNSVTQKWNVDGIQRVGIFARRNVLPNEEITIDYNFSHFGEAVDCKCGSTTCTGKIGRKLSEVPNFLAASAASARKRNEALEAPPPEIKRPVHVSSLALLKSAQLDRAWLHLYGFNKRRLFFSHREPKQPKLSAASSEKIKAEEKCVSNASSPLSEKWSTTSVEDDTSASSTISIASTTTASATEKSKSNWYERVIRGEHLEEMRGLHSYICGGKSDWSKDLSSKRPGRPPSKTTLMKRKLALEQRAQKKTKNLIRKRLNLLEARSRCVADLVAFAEGKSKWNKRLSSPGNMDPDRILRLIKHVNDPHIFFNPDQNDLNEDACYRCGLAGELICCDGCPAAFHLNCTNLAMVPPANVPWFCSECTKPKYLAAAAASSSSATEAAAEQTSSATVSLGRRQLRTHAAPLVPSLKKIFHSRAPSTELAKRRHKKRARAADRSYRQLEHGPLPSWNDADASDV